MTQYDKVGQGMTRYDKADDKADDKANDKATVYLQKRFVPQKNTSTVGVHNCTTFTALLCKLNTHSSLYMLEQFKENQNPEKPERNCQRLFPWEPRRSAFSSPFDFLFFT